MKKFFLLGCVVLGSSISAMEKVISEPMSDLTLTDEVIRAVAAQAVAHYDAVVMSKENASLEDREEAYSAFYAYLQSLACEVNDKIADTISRDFNRSDIYGYRLIYMGDQSNAICLDNEAQRVLKIRIQSKFVELSECAKESVLEFLIDQQSSLVHDLVGMLTIEQLSNCGFFIEEKLSDESNDGEYIDEDTKAFMEETRKLIKRLLTQHYDAVINLGQPIKRCKKTSAISKIMSQYLTAADELFLVQFSLFLNRHSQKEQQVLLNCLVLEYGCSSFRQATQVANVLFHLLQASLEIDVVHRARMLMHVYHLFNQMYPATGTLVNTYARHCDARARVFDVLGECVAFYQARSVFSFLHRLGHQGTDSRALIDEAKRVEISTALKRRILWKLLCWDDNKLLNTIHHPESYLHGVIEVLLPHFLSHDDFSSFIDDSEIIAWHQQVGIETPFRDILYLHLGHLIPVVNLGQYERVVAEYTELLAVKNAAASKP